jgi:acyl dehydratase
MTVTEDAIIRFGLEWDAQPFHIDAHAAKSSIFGSLVASGLHTLLISYRMFHATLGCWKALVLQDLGCHDIRFPKPVHPGDTVHVRVTVEELRPSRRSGGGIATFHLEIFNQNEINVLSLSVAILVARRED